MPSSGLSSLDASQWLVERFEWHYTPKDGSWLDMAETEISVVSTQCLDRRIPDKQTLVEEIAEWQRRRNQNHTKADWQFMNCCRFGGQQVKLTRPYPRTP